MKTVAVEESQDLKLGDLLKLLGNDDVVVLTEAGEGRYVLGAVDELEWEAFSLSRNAEFTAYLDACRARGNREGAMPIEEVRRRFGVDG